MSPTRTSSFDPILLSLTAAILAWAVLAAVVLSSLAPLGSLDSSPVFTRRSRTPAPAVVAAPAPAVLVGRAP